MSENQENTKNHEKVLQDLKDFVTETKLLAEKVMKMRIQCKELQVNMLRLFDPKCIEIREMLNELCSKNLKPSNKNKRMGIRRRSTNETLKVHFQ